MTSFIPFSGKRFCVVGLVLGLGLGLRLGLELAEIRLNTFRLNVHSGSVLIS